MTRTNATAVRPAIFVPPAPPIISLSPLELDGYLLISTKVSRHSGGVFEGGFLEEGADFFGIALQGEH